MKKKLVAIICASMMAFVGCGGTSSSSSEDSGSGAEVTETTDEESEETSEDEASSEDETSEVTADLATENLDEIVMVIEGVEIPKALYMLYDYTTTQNFYSMNMYTPWDSEVEGMTEVEYIELRIRETLESIVATVKYAEENGITITEEDQIEIDMATEEFMANLPAEVIAQIGFTSESLKPYMSESFLHSKVYEEIALTYTMNEAGYQEYYDENSALIAEDYTLLDLNSILVEDGALAEEINTKALAGEDFNALFAQYDISTTDPASEETGALSISKGQFLNTFTDVQSVELGQVIGPCEMNGSYFIFLVENIDAPVGADLDEIVTSIYQSNEEVEYTDNIITGMMDELEIEVYEDVISSVERFYQ